ncbi:hypothetical protein GIB67_002142 [Kingdonia uniflora]|uniref:Uncharacterized protein n=1 Tax=Kingdonia uniflora TaxID=39325 RepID=A0A7J7KWK3_9MAGN|nr:hypothetical protein GIB67_002142 [Kingdonia uniflora]
MSLGHCVKSGTNGLRDTLKYNIWCNDGKVVSRKWYDMPDRFRRTYGLVQESRTVYSKTLNRQRFGERCISTPSLLSPNTKTQKQKRRVREIEISTDDSITAEAGKDKRKTMSRSLYCEQREEAEIEEVLKKLQKLHKLVRTNAVDSHSATDGAYPSSRSSRPCFFDLSLAGRVWNDNLLWVSGKCLQRSDEKPLELNNRTIIKGISCKVSRKESFIDSTAKEGTELELARLNKMPDGPVDMATVSNTVIHNLAKKKAVKRGAASRSATSDSLDDSCKRRKVTRPAKSQVVLEESIKIAEGPDLRPCFEVETGLMEEQCRAKAREKGLLLLKMSLRRWRLWHLGEGNYEKKEIVNEEEVEEMEDGLNVTEKTVADNLETIDQEIESLRLRVVDLEGLLEVEKNSSVDLEMLLEGEKSTLLYNAKYAEENKALISQYEDRLDDNVKLSLKLEEAKSQVEDKTATLLSRDLALNQLISELAELKERVASGSRHNVELVEYRIRALNDEISDMKCSIRALNEQLLKREIDLDTAQTNLAVSVADFEKLSNSIMCKD